MTFKKLILWFGIFGSIASILSVVFIFIPKNDNIQLIVNTQSIERLTQNFEDKEPNLKVDYKFKGIEIKNLLKYNIEFQNKSKKTIIGNGNQKNILLDNFTLKLKEGYDILDYKKIKSDFNNRIIVDSTEVKIYFEQWRENEVLEYSFYVKTDNAKPDTLLLQQPDFRQIIDGDILFNIKENNKVDNKITSVFPQKIRQASYIIVLIFLGLFILALTVSIFIIPIGYINIKSWKSKNYAKYTSLVETVFSDDNYKKTRLLENPKDAPQLLWEKFDGDKYPSIVTEMDKIYEPIIAFIVVLFFNIVFFIT
jgi:hypothetical protein